MYVEAYEMSSKKTIISKDAFISDVCHYRLRIVPDKDKAKPKEKEYLRNVQRIFPITKMNLFKILTLIHNCELLVIVLANTSSSICTQD